MGFAQPGLGSAELGKCIIELLLGFDALLTQCLQAVEAGFGNLGRGLSAGEASLGFGEPGTLLGIIEKDDDLTFLDRVALLHTDPANNADKARAQFDALPVDDVSACGEEHTVLLRWGGRGGRKWGRGGGAWLMGLGL